MIHKVWSKKGYVLLYGAFLLYSLSTIFAKCASQAGILEIRFFVFIAMEIACLALYAILWQQVLRRFSLLTAMSSKGIVVVFSLLWAAMLFGENITVNNLIGAVFIILGIRLVSKDE